MGVIKQLKQFLTNTNIFPVTKTNAVYDDSFGRLDTFLGLSIRMSDNTVPDASGSSKMLVDTSGNQIFPVTKFSSVFDATHGTLDQYLAELAELVTSANTAATNASSTVESHVSAAGTGSVLGHVKLSDVYNSKVSNGAAKDGLCASQNALYSAYSAIMTKFSTCVTANNTKTSTTLNFLGTGVWRVSGITASNSPSGSDTSGILVNLSVINTTAYQTSTTLQLFYGKDTNQVHCRIQWNDDFTYAWVKLSA